MIFPLFEWENRASGHTAELGTTSSRRDYSCRGKKPRQQDERPSECWQRETYKNYRPNTTSGTKLQVHNFEAVLNEKFRLLIDAVRADATPQKRRPRLRRPH